MPYQNCPLVLLILDGWGHREQGAHNAISLANTPQWDAWWSDATPHLLLQACGTSVGLPPDQMGNSEVGHMHMGAGRIVFQELTRINEAIRTQEFEKNPTLNRVIDSLKKTKKTWHIMGLLSDGGVHSHEEHLFSLIKLCAKRGLDNLCLHLFLDGRDTPPQSALDSLARLNKVLEQYPIARIASITGRYYAMDRDKRWDRIAPVVQLLTQAQAARSFSTAQQAITHYYDQKIFDEFIPPTRIGEPAAIESGDAVFFFNFRADRARQLSAALVEPGFSDFPIPHQPQLAHFVSMTQYDANLPTQPAFPPHPLHHTLGEVLSHHGLRQLRLAETEKYTHVTFFFNGGAEHVYPLEERILVPSPKVATYDLQPEMSAPQITQTLIDAIEQDRFDVIICNFANADMVGHSGNLDAAIKAIECLDESMRLIAQSVKKQGGVLLITADHGNAELMYDEDIRQPHTAHTTYPVPFVCVGADDYHLAHSQGSLIDIAPTILTLLGIEPPPEMTGHSLLEKNCDPN